MKVRGVQAGWLRIALAAIVSVAVSACAVKRAEVPVPVELPGQFSESGDGPFPEKWWTAFEDPQLDALVEEALAGNFSLQTAWDRLAAAESLARIEGAALSPQVDLNAGGGRIRERRAGDTSSRSRFDLGLSASYEVDLWGRIRSRRQAALADVEASREDVDAAAITLTANIAETWYELGAAREEQRVLRNQTTTNEQVLELLTFRFRRGRAEAADVLRQRQLVESTQGDLVLAKLRAETAAYRLAVLVGRPPRSEIPVESAMLVSLPALPSTGIPSELLQERPDVRSAYLAVQAEDLRVAEAVADRFPRISITAGGDTSDDNVRDLFDNWMLNVAANLVQPVVDGGRRRAEVERRRAFLSESIHAYGQTVLDTLEEVERALVRETRQTEYLASLDKQLDTAGTVIERTRDSFLQGQLDYLRVLDALTSRQRLERQYVLAKRDRISARIDLGRSLAGGWPVERPELANLKEPSETASKN
jgi:NodT family efflux transporter outer membrane factor (OMF) lipoprotein